MQWSPLPPANLHIRRRLLPLVIVLTTPWLHLQAATDAYKDDFTGVGKALDTRKTGHGFGKWEADLAVTAGDGILTVDGEKSQNQVFFIKMPSLEKQTKIRVLVRARSSGKNQDSHISFGFIPSAASNPLTTAALWTIDRSDSFALMYSAGPGNQNQTVGTDWYGEFPRDNTQETEHIIEYNLKTGHVTISIENNGNQRVLVDNAPVNWDGVVGQPIPLDNLAYFAISFYQQEPTEKGADAAYIKNIEIEVSDR